MKRKKLQWSALLMALLLMFSLTACGASSGSASYSAMDSSSASRAEASYSDYGYYAEEAAVELNDSYTDSAKSSASGSSADAQQAQDAQGTGEKAKVKIIYTANLNVEALDLDTAVDALNMLVEEMGGYYQSSDRGSTGRSRYASYTVRVPSSKYRAFLDAWSDSENCKLTSIHEDTEDVGVRYFDLETHLSTLRNKMNRLQALLDQATEMEDIIQLESAISDTEYQINLYTSDLNRYDSLLNYSTVNLYLTEVVKLVEDEQVSFLQRLGQNLRWGVLDFCEDLEELIIWVAYHLISIIIVVVIVVLFALRKRKKAAQRTHQRRKQQQPNPQPTQYYNIVDTDTASPNADADSNFTSSNPNASDTDE